MPDVRERYGHALPTIFKEVWREEDLPADPQLTVWIVNPGQHFIVDERVLQRYPGLRLIATPSTGRNHIDQAATRRRGVAVRGLLDNREALDRISASSEFTFLLLLNALRRLDFAAAEVRNRRWRERDEELRGRELQGKVVGVIGLGRIGRRLVRYCRAFDAKVLYHDPYVHDATVPSRSIEEVFRQADIVCICCLLTPETTRLIGEPLLRLLKPEAVLVNTSRGEVVDEAALARVLRARPDIRFAADVLEGEVTDTHLKSELLEFADRGQATITPHIAGITAESMQKAALITLGLVEDFLAQESESDR